MSVTIRSNDMIIKLKGEIEALKWLLDELASIDTDVVFIKNNHVMLMSDFLEVNSSDLKTFLRNYIKQSMELFESELQRLTKAESHKRIKYNGDGINTCRVCGKPLHFEAYDREDYVYKQEIKARGKRKTVYYCGYNCRRKDE